MALPGSGMGGLFGRGPGGFLGFGRTPIGAIRPTAGASSSRPTGFAGDALSRGGARTPNTTITRPSPRSAPLTPAQRGAQTRATNRAAAAKAEAERQQTADKNQANLERAAKVGIGVAGSLGLSAGVIAAKIISSNNNRNTNSSGAYHRGSGGYEPTSTPYDPNLNPAPTVSSSSRTTNMDNPSKLAFYLAQAKAKNLTGKDASNYAYTRLKEYKRGGRVRGGL